MNVSLFCVFQDVVTYYLNLTYANIAKARWEKEYRLTEAFGVPDASPASMNHVLEMIANDKCYLQKYYEFNSVNYDRSVCDADCRIDHVCAIREVNSETYEKCVVKEGAEGAFLAVPTFLSIAFGLSVSMWANY